MRGRRWRTRCVVLEGESERMIVLSSSIFFQISFFLVEKIKLERMMVAAEVS